MLPIYLNYVTVQITTRNFTLNGLKAHEFTYTGFHTTNQKYEYARIIAFEKRYSNKEENYVIMCTAMDLDIEKAKTMFTMVIGAFKVQ